MTMVPVRTMSGAEMVELCRRHTIYEWSAQSTIDPIPVARAEGRASGRPMASGTWTSTAS